ncbi:MAG: alternative ribosome rescue aminoacyl-tRNA hydrolase ArfB [Rhodobacterales bacterium]|jgi:ribosome-associated protein|tara:strand:- start:341 stop:763 length:423 start_codon:yes stop_codon:yes gene_type:complete
MIKVTESISIADWELTETFSTSQGPGGQNVNKVSTAVELRFSAEKSPHLSDSLKSRLKKLSGSNWTSDGILIINVQETRSQYRNRLIAKQKLKKLILEATQTHKRRIPTKPSARTQANRINTKKNRGLIKILRGKINNEN